MPDFTLITFGCIHDETMPFKVLSLYHTRIWKDLTILHALSALCVLFKSIRSRLFLQMERNHYSSATFIWAIVIEIFFNELCRIEIDLSDSVGRVFAYRANVLDSNLAIVTFSSFGKFPFNNKRRIINLNNKKYSKSN